MIVIRLTLVLGLLSALCAAQAGPSNRELPQASAEDNGVSSEKLRAMETAVRAGEFKKIGSVLVARHGKLVYEAYFDGDASTLRDTRSATKSITDVLIGIAVQEK